MAIKLVKEIEKLEAIKNGLESRIEERDERFKCRSEKWQEGEKGDAWATQTDDLQTAIDDLDSVICALGDLAD